MAFEWNGVEMNKLELLERSWEMGSGGASVKGKRDF